MIDRLRHTPRAVRMRLWIHRNVLGLAVASVLMLAGSLALGGFALHKAVDEGRARARVDAARSAQNHYDEKLSAHQACLRQSTGRAEVRQSFHDVFGFLAAAATSTKEGHDELVAFAKESEKAIDRRLPDIACGRVAPQPHGPRPLVPG